MELIVYGAMSIINIALVLALIQTQLKRADLQTKLFRVQVENDKMYAREHAVVTQEMELRDSARQIKHDAELAYKVGWTQELNHMLHDEGWTPEDTVPIARVVL